MATVRHWVPTCPSASRGYAQATALGDPGAYVAKCPVGSGAWVELEYVQPFDPSQLNPADLGATFSVGFVVVATALLVSIPVRIIVKAVRDFF